MKSILDENTYKEVLGRIHKLNDTSQRQWGRMTVGQMMNHCQQPLNVALGSKTLAKPNFFMKLLFKGFKRSLYNDKQWGKGMPTAKEFKVVGNKEFLSEKDKLVTLVAEFYKKRTQEKWPEHPAFGQFTPQQWGQMQYKHLDHHLRQFGV